MTLAVVDVVPVSQIDTTPCLSEKEIRLLFENLPNDNRRILGKKEIQLNFNQEYKSINLIEALKFHFEGKEISFKEFAFRSPVTPIRKVFKDILYFLNPKKLSVEKMRRKETAFEDCIVEVSSVHLKIHYNETPKNLPGVRGFVPLLKIGSRIGYRYTLMVRLETITDPKIFSVTKLLFL